MAGLKRKLDEEQCSELALCADILRRLRSEEQVRAAAYESSARDDVSYASSASQEEHLQMAALRIVSVLLRLDELVVSKSLLAQTGAGREVNHRFIRKHPDKTVRMESQKLVQKWRDIVTRRTTCSDASRAGKGQAERSASSPARSGRGARMAASPGGASAQDGRLDGTGPVRSSHGEGDAASAFKDWSVQRLKAAMCALGLHTELSSCVEKADLAAALRRYVEALFAGRWCIDSGHVAVAGNTITWEDGWKAAFQFTDVDAVCLHWEGTVLHGKLKNDRLSWDDGDVWIRSRGQNGQRPAKKAAPAAAKERLSISKAKRLSLLSRRPGCSARCHTRRRLSVDPLASRKADIRHELKRIAAARTPAAILGLDGNNTTSRGRRLSRGTWSAFVQSRYRELTRLVHPDKCPADLQSRATAAFQILTDAKNRLLQR
eukprot:TRINITY_DN26433_c0_g1_i1.p1 TRINITY_DN26433_c0_g1~~TRINITY_DN26433_c0_g1_i1.p1  ORF type:complete len:433 (+),score=64.00 TRINITY_DN26433_c0_g1_i1:114-1412(+)